MTDPIPLPLDDDDRLYEPPLVDSVRYDTGQQIYVIQFVPSDDVSSDPAEMVVLAKEQKEFHRVDVLFGEIVRLMGGKAISHIVHAGGGSYTIHFSDGTHAELSDESSNETVQEISDRLKQIAESAQAAFHIVSLVHASS
jgi:hypothetical protein